MDKLSLLFGMLTFARSQYQGYPGYPQYQPRHLQNQYPFQWQQNNNPFASTNYPQYNSRQLYYNPQYAPVKSYQQHQKQNHGPQSSSQPSQTNSVPQTQYQQQQPLNLNSTQNQQSQTQKKSLSLPRLPHRSEPPQYPRQPNQQGNYGEYRHPSSLDLASMKPEDHPNDPITKAVVNMQDIVPTPQLKYDENENPAISFGNDGFAKGLGDRAASPGEYPFNVQVRRDGIFICGAALVKSPVTGRHIIVTAAHCLTETGSTTVQDPSTYEVRMGFLGLDDVGQIRRVVTFLVHPNYCVVARKVRGLFNDIGVLILDRDFEENEMVKPIALPSAPGPTLLDKVVVTGWGRGREAGNPATPKVLRSVELPVWDNSDCGKVYFNEGGMDLINEGHFCAGAGEGGLDTCQGDSGGAAMALHRGSQYLAGVVGWGKGCGNRGYPGVYTRVWTFVDWIRQSLYDYEKLGKLPAPTRKENIL